jgi:hypothetical protein
MRYYGEDLVAVREVPWNQVKFLDESHFDDRGDFECVVLVGEERVKRGCLSFVFAADRFAQEPWVGEARP